MPPNYKPTDKIKYLSPEKIEAIEKRRNQIISTVNKVGNIRLSLLIKKIDGSYRAVNDEINKLFEEGKIVKYYKNKQAVYIKSIDCE